MNSLTTEINLICIHSEYIMREDGILEIQLKEGFYFTLKESKEITQNIISITNGIPVKVLIVAGTLSLSDDEARKYSTTKESSDPIHSLAIITCSLPQSIIANFIMKFQKPRIPTKVFKTYEEAENWLRLI